MKFIHILKPRRNLFLIGVFVLIGFIYLDRRFGYDTYRVDGWCLSFKPSEVEWPHGGLFTRETSPFFFVRAPIPYEGAGAPSNRGIVVHYWKQSPTERQHRIDEGGSIRWGCSVRDAKFDLVELHDGDNKCRLAAFHERYEIKKKDGLDAAVSISCSKDTSVKNCRIRDVMPNNWEARIAIPKSSLSEWRVATSAARTFFDQKLQDCGT